VFRAAPFGSTTAIVMPEGPIYGAFSPTRDLALFDFSFSKFEIMAAELTLELESFTNSNCSAVLALIELAALG
jgi:hypothetical protein